MTQTAPSRIHTPATGLVDPQGQPVSSHTERATVISAAQQYAELEAELALLGPPEPMEGMRDEQGRWIGPYIRFNAQLLDSEPDAIRPDGQRSRFTSFAAAFPSNQKHTLMIDIDSQEIGRIKLSDKGEIFGVGHLTNGMTLEAIGRLSSTVMFPALTHENWRRGGTITNRREDPGSRYGSGKSALLTFFPHVRLPEPGLRGRIRAVTRNYWAIERDRELAASARSAQRPRQKGTWHGQKRAR